MNHKLFLDRMKDRDFDNDDFPKTTKLLKEIQAEMKGNFQSNPEIFDKILYRPVGLWINIKNSRLCLY